MFFFFIGRRSDVVQELAESRRPPPDNAAQVNQLWSRGCLPAAGGVHPLHGPHRRGGQPAARPAGQDMRLHRHLQGHRELLTRAPSHLSSGPPPAAGREGTTTNHFFSISQCSRRAVFCGLACVARHRLRIFSFVVQTVASTRNFQLPLFDCYNCWKESWVGKTGWRTDTESDWTQKCKQSDRANQRPFSVLRPYTLLNFSLNSCKNSMISIFGAWHEWTDMLCWYHPRISNFH